MTHLRSTLLSTLMIVASLLSVPAFAHTEATSANFITGVLHPLSGIDHLLAMIAVGMWAAQQKGKTCFNAPASFLAMLFIGFILGVNAITLPFIETGIALSVLLLGLMLTLTIRLPKQLALALIGSFALYHGIAHGAEFIGASAALFAFGFMLSTLVLHILGLYSSQKLQSTMPIMIKTLGSFIAITGATLLVS